MSGMSGSGGGSTRGIQRALQLVRAFDARRPWLWDVLLPLLVALPGVAVLVDGTWRDGPEDVQVGPPPDGIPPSWPWLLSAGLVLPLLWRRRWPFAMFLVISGFLFVAGRLGVSLPVALSVVVALYGVALRSPMSRLGWAGASVLATVAAETVAGPPHDFARSYVPVFAITAAAVAAGIAVRTRREYLASLLERAERLEVERDQRARLAAAAERARIAREMHDVLAHNLSVITGLADGGSYAGRRSPERARQALDAIAATSREALDDLRGLLGVLKDTGTHGELAPQPGLPDLDPLLERVRAAGLPVRADVEGTAADAGEHSPGRQLTVYRVVQEALTNTLKHGGSGATATVTVAYGRDGLTVTVTDSGTGSAPSDPGGGQGIGGMRDRARAYGGTLEAGPARGGGWRVHLWLPRTTTDGTSDHSSDRGRPGHAALRLPDAAGEPGRPDAAG
ncbi:sensor histidine kinase [Streptomyces sp. NPDC048172]|uniref:sensor histidine kinase n=1 Tax=Streptomyces sp. NPDC048172 TaxID=3365505 RepID=UPI003716547E